MSVVAHSAPASPSSTIGVVDLDAVAKQYKGYQLAMARMETFAREREAVFTTLRTGVGLTEADFREYRGLAGSAVKVNPTRIKELEELASKNQAEYQALSEKAEKGTPTDAEKSRLSELEKQIEIVSAIINEDGGKLTKEIQGEYGRYTNALTELVDKAIAKVSENRKLALVVSRDVRTQSGTEKFVLWGGVDITEEISKYLNDTFKDGLLDLPPVNNTTPANATPPAKK